MKAANHSHWKATVAIPLLKQSDHKQESGEDTEGEVNGWISVEDRLPKEGGRYWCYIKELTDLGWSYFQWNCAYNEKEKRFNDSTLTNGENVTHWQPLPPPPHPNQTTNKINRP